MATLGESTTDERLNRVEAAIQSFATVAVGLSRDVSALQTALRIGNKVAGPFGVPEMTEAITDMSRSVERLANSADAILAVFKSWIYVTCPAAFSSALPVGPQGGSEQPVPGGQGFDSPRNCTCGFWPAQSEGPPNDH